MSYFAAHPDEAAIFDAAMVAKSLRVVPTVVDAYDFSQFAVVADIGGGRGHLLQGILERNPQTSGVLFEVPRVIANATAVASPRLRLAAGDFFADALPAADAYVLMDLLHDWSDADATRILGAVRRAAPTQARVLIVETLVGEQPGPHFGKTLDVIMLAVTGGRERTPSEHGRPGRHFVSARTPTRRSLRGRGRALGGPLRWSNTSLTSGPHAAQNHVAGRECKHSPQAPSRRRATAGSPDSSSSPRLAPAYRS
jgi:hypothetical protein